MIAVRDTIPTIAIKISTALISNSIKVVSVNLLLRKPIILCCIYIPPCTDNLLLSEVIQYFSTLINSYPSNLLVLVGDFNLPDINWDKLTASSTASRTFWFTPELRHLSKCLHTLRKKVSKKPTSYLRNKLELQTSALSDKIQSAKSLYKSQLVANCAGNCNSKI